MVVLHTISIISSTCGACSEAVFEFEWRATYSDSLRAKLILALLGMPRGFWSSLKQYRMFSIPTYTLHSNMHQILTQQGRCCMHNNQLLTKSLVELEDYSILSIKLWPVETDKILDPVISHKHYYSRTEFANSIHDNITSISRVWA